MLNVPRWRVIAVLVAAVWAIVFAAPNFLSEQTRAALPDFVPKQALNLGLDLQGGSYLLLEVDSAKLRRDQLDNALDEITRALADERPRIRTTGRAVMGEVIRLRASDAAEQDRAVEAISALGRPQAAALGGGGENRFQVSRGEEGLVEVRITEAARDAAVRDAVAQSIEVLRRRIDPTGTTEVTIVRQGADRIVVQAPGESDPEALKARIGRTAQMTFHLVDDTVTAQDVAEQRLPPGVEVLPQDDPSEPFVAVRRRAALSGENLVDASPGFDPQTNAPIVNFAFDATGSRIFCRLTNENVGRRFATVLDGVVITAPRINTSICGGRGYIEGNFTVESADELAVLLKAGALPAPLTVIEQRTVGAELGQDAINAGAIAGVLAAIGVLVFMGMAYGLFGLFACVALILNMTMILAAMTVFGATLTLPGIAGLILTMAMAVDANVLIYERMRDEAALGRAPAIAMDAGFNRAFWTIFDANVTTIAAAVILFAFGEGPVKGFAWTLSIGVLTSVFTAVLVTQALLALWYRTARPKALPI